MVAAVTVVTADTAADGGTTGASWACLRACLQGAVTLSTWAMGFARASTLLGLVVLGACANGAETVGDQGGSQGTDGGSSAPADDAGSGNGNGNGQGEGGASMGTDAGASAETGSPLPGGTKRIFATKGQQSGNLGGLSGADSTCQSAATGAKLGGTWKAWLSDSSASAPSRMSPASKYVLVDGKTVVFNGPIGGMPLHDLDMDETGVVDNRGLVWTGTTVNGASTGHNCSDWHSAGTDGTAGLAYSAEIKRWGDDGTATACNLNGRLYCVEQ